jgi:hypothetical protein
VSVLPAIGRSNRRGKINEDLVCGCALRWRGVPRVYEKQDLTGSAGNSAYLPPASRIYVALPADGAYETRLTLDLG